MGKIFWLIGWFTQIGREEPRFDYPQTWYLATKLPKRMQRFCKWFCGLTTKHEWSDTEWSYGGGEYADRWCRWCNQIIKVPKESVYFTHPYSREMMKDVGKTL